MRRPSRPTLVFFCCLGVLGVLIGGVAVADTVGPSAVHELTPGNEAETAAQDEQRPAIMIDVQDSSNYLSQIPTNISQQSHDQNSLDVSGAVQSDALRLQGAHKRLEVAERFETADSETDVSLDVIETLEEDLAGIEQEYRLLFQNYSSEEISTSKLVKEVVRLGVTGQQYRELTEMVQEQHQQPPDLDLRYSNLHAEVGLLPSPLVSHVDSEFRSTERTPLYVQGGEDSLVLATVVDETYLREALLFGEREVGAPEQFGSGSRTDVADANQRAVDLYPWTMDDSPDPEIRGFGDSSVYRLEASYSHGELRSYMDGATRNPFYEIHEKNPFSVPATDFTQQTDSGLRLSIESTAPTGPMRIDVLRTDESTGPITIYVDGTPVGTVEDGGDIWTVQPRESFQVAAETADGDRLSVLIVT